jgi:hypothetical protein
VSAPRDPWADPATPTEPGAPYAGPPITGPPPAAPGWAPPGYGNQYGPGYPYGAPPAPGYPAPYPAWGWPVPPAPPRKPGQVIAAAVLSFVQAALVLVASLYVFLFASVAEIAAGAPGFSASRTEELAAEGQILATVQLASAIALVVAGIMALSRRTHAAWLLLVVTSAVQVLLALYWMVRLTGLVGDGVDSGGALAASAMFFLAGPAVALGLVLTGAGRRWFAETAQV